MGTNRKAQERRGNLLENLFIVFLAFYPLRHMGWGLDLWDTGYSYANFQYMGTEHMDPMWLFSTYLANVAGNWLTGLPGADTLRGMNLYTGLFVSALALAGYFFCTRKLKMPKVVAFVGEMAAISLCWCPTAVLYNYLTYVLFLGAFILLYLGLAKEKKGFLIGAGALLGANVLVRFSNLPEMGMIVAVWAYDIILWLEERKGKEPSTGGMGRKKGICLSIGRGAGSRDGKYALNEGAGTGEGGGMPAGRGAKARDSMGDQGGKGTEGASFWQRVLKHTRWCFLGYAVAVALLLNYIHICYGIDAYFAGISRLFSMTDTAAGYKPAAMIMGILGRYVENLYWVVRIGVILLVGMALFAVAGWLEGRLAGPGNGNAASGLPGRGAQSGNSGSRPGGRPFAEEGGKLAPAREPGAGIASIGGPARLLHIGIRLLWAAVSIAMLAWLYKRDFCSFLFYSYDPIMRPGTLFLMLAMVIAVIRIFHRDSPREEKLLSGMVVLAILLTSIGSNNGVMPSMNNLFVAAPYTLWESWRFLANAGDKRLKWGFVVSSFPAKGILAAFLALCLFQFGGFGVKFAFAEATGIQEANTYVGNNAVLKNVKMSPEKAQWMSELSGYVNENELQGMEVILYGDIPALAYYLQMPPAFNSWCDLDSYQLEVMEEELAGLEGLVIEKGQKKPVIILEDAYALYREGSAGETGQEIGADPKWMRLMEFMDKLGYECTFRNVKFGLYR